jgi:beta-lactamase superfamily II metal-dependent hydrolase
MRVRALQAEDGDAIWIEWDGHPRILVDAGRTNTGRAIRAQANTPEGPAGADLVILTHIDADHIAGAFSLWEDSEPGVAFGTSEVWFNSRKQLGPPTDNYIVRSVGQALALEKLIEGRGWNAAANRGAIAAGQEAKLDDAHITVLGPTLEQLADLIPEWKKEVAKLERRASSHRVAKVSPTALAVPANLEELTNLADSGEPLGTNEANTASIVALVERDMAGDTYRVLLTGDASEEGLCEAIRSHVGKGPLRLSAIKAPHHGSEKNVSRNLVEAIDCPVWIFSSDGDNHGHPSPPAVARVVLSGTRPLHLAFTHRTVYTEIWEKCQDTFGFTTSYGSDFSGVVVDLQPISKEP